jgi:hypothetical protein
MKHIIYVVLLLTLVSCNQKSKWRYQITGFVKTKSGPHEAIAYTDTIYGANRDSVWYYNTDGSKLTIIEPYEIKKLK